MSETEASERGFRVWLGSELGARVASGLVLAIVALLATYRGGWPFTLFWLVAGIVIIVEWVDMTGTQPSRRIKFQLGLCLACVTLAVLSQGPDSSLRLLLSIALIMGGGIAVLGLTLPRRDGGWAVGGLFYAVVIVLVPPIVRDHPELGIVGLLWMFAVVWTTDIAAYFIGRKLGGPKLWSAISPKKTWSGFLGGLAAGTGAGIVVFLVAARQGWTPVASFGLVAVISGFGSVASQIGDLGESALKRRFGVKDSGHLIPGHGGVMDRLDGFWALALLMGGIMAGVSAVRG